MERTLGRVIDALARQTIGTRGWLWLVGYALLLAITSAGNLTETDDAYTFAWRTERVPATHFDDPRLLAYHLLARLLWLLLQPLGVVSDGLTLLRTISGVCAVACIGLVFRLFVDRLALPRPVALLGSAALAASYGFWRYAVEADVYPVAMAATVAVLYGLLALPARPAQATAAGSASCGATLGPALRAGICGCAAGVAVLVYQPTVIPLLLAFVPLVAWRSGLRPALAYGGAIVAIVAAGYAAAFAANSTGGAGAPVVWTIDALRGFLAQRSQEFMIAPLSPRVVAVSTLRSLLALGHDVASANWLFGFAPLTALVSRLFSAHELADDRFMGEHAGDWVWAAVATALLLLVASLRLLGLCLSLRHRSPRPAGPGCGAPPQRAVFAAVLIWSGLTALVIGRLNPGGLEAWTVMLLPLALLLGAWVFAPLVARHGSGPPALWVAALLLHNLIGGMTLVQDARGDAAGQRCAMGAAVAQAEDLFVVLGFRLAECLRWRTPAMALALHPLDAPRLGGALHGDNPLSLISIGRSGLFGHDVTAEAMQRLGPPARGRLLVFDDLFATAPSPLARPGDAERLHEAARHSRELARHPVLGALRQWPPRAAP